MSCHFFIRTVRFGSKVKWVRCDIVTNVTILTLLEMVWCIWIRTFNGSQLLCLPEKVSLIVSFVDWQFFECSKLLFQALAYDQVFVERPSRTRLLSLVLKDFHFIHLTARSPRMSTSWQSCRLRIFFRVFWVCSVLWSRLKVISFYSLQWYQDLWSHIRVSRHFSRIGKIAKK